MRMPFIQKVDPVFQKELGRVFQAYESQIAYLENRVATLERKPSDSGSAWTPAHLSQTYTLAAALTLSAGDMNQVHYVNCTIASDITLPTAVEGEWVDIRNEGTATITVKNPAAATVATVAQDQYATVPVVQDGAGAFEYPTGVAVSAVDGSIYLGADTVVSGSGANTQVAYFDGTSTLVGSSAMTFVTATGQLALSTTGSGAGLLLGGDFQIYRSAANEGRTPDSLVIDTNLTVASLTSGRVPYASTGGLLVDSARFTANVAVADGASAVAYINDTDNALSTTGARIASFRHGGTEAVAIGKRVAMVANTPLGEIHFPGTTQNAITSLGGFYFDGLAAGKNLFFRGYSNAFFEQQSTMLRTGDASSTATQKPSYIYSFQQSLWTGSAASSRTWQLSGQPSTTVDLECYFQFKQLTTEYAKLYNTGQLQLPITGSGAGLLLGGDFQIYRSAADVGLTPDTFVAATLRVSGDTGGATSQNTLSGVTDTPTTDPGWASSDTVAMNAPDGYIKAYVGTQAVVLPYWNT